MKNNNYLLYLFIIILVGFQLVSCGRESHDTNTFIVDSNSYAIPEGSTSNINAVSDTCNEIISSDNKSSNPFYLIHQAFTKTKGQLLIILELLIIVLLILSLILFLAEHVAQPKVYKHFPTSLLWTFVKSVQDPGEMAPPKPITFLGKVVANIIGLVGVALFALPAGIISSGFIAALDDEKKAVQIRENIETLHLAFERKKDRLTGFQIVPKYISVVEIQARLGLKEDEILDAVRNDPHFRITNLSITQNAEEHPQDKLAVEHYTFNTVYGQCIDRGSKVTIFSPSNIVDPIMGWWSYYLAKIGGFNYISREFGQTRPYQSYCNYDPENDIPGRKEFMEDINRLASTEDSWIFTLMPASGSNEPTYPSQFHFCYGSKKGDTTYHDPNITLIDTAKFEAFYQSVSKIITESYELKTDKQLYHDNSNPKLFVRHLHSKNNAISLRVAWSVICWDMRAINIAKDIAYQINTKILELDGNPDSPDLYTKDIGYKGYSN